MMDWSDDAIAQLRQLWIEGHSTAEIGRRLTTTKNAIVGKAHRLGLSARPSPIQRHSEEGSGTSRNVKRPSNRHFHESANFKNKSVMRLSKVDTVADLRVIQQVPKDNYKLMSCCWPLGEPGTANFRFCGKIASSGKPYCPDHAAIAYIRVRDRHQNTA